MKKTNFWKEKSLMKLPLRRVNKIPEHMLYQLLRRGGVSLVIYIKLYKSMGV